MAGIHALGDRQAQTLLGDLIGEILDLGHACGRGQSAPHAAVKGPPGGGNRRFGIRCARPGDGGKGKPRPGIVCFKRLAARRIHKLPVDKQLILVHGSPPLRNLFMKDSVIL